MKRTTRVNYDGTTIVESPNGYYPAIMIDNKYCAIIKGADFFDFKEGIRWIVIELSYSDVLGKWLPCTGTYTKKGYMYVSDKNYVDSTGTTIQPPMITVDEIDSETDETIQMYKPDLSVVFPQFTFFKASPIGQGIFQLLLSNLSNRIPEL